jgi:hypothetical protein
MVINVTKSIMCIYRLLFLSLALQMLTCRREGDWGALAARVGEARADFASHAAEEEADLLPALSAHCSRAELASAAVRFWRSKARAPLMPQTPEVRVALAEGSGAGGDPFAPLAGGEGPAHLHTEAGSGPSP